MNKISKVSILHISFFLLFLSSSSLYGMEDLESYSLVSIPQNTQVSISQLKVTKEEWVKIDEFLEETRKIIPESDDRKNKVFAEYYKPVFSRYYDLYEMLFCKNKHTIKMIQKDLRKNLLEPLGHFVAIFESFYDLVRTHYRTKSNEYAIHKDRLENIIFPIVQKTFNVFMQTYEITTKDKVGNIGPLKDNSEFLSVVSENVKKHIFYKRDPNGFLLFTIFPHQEIEKNLYQTYLPYIFHRTPDYISDTVLFSLFPFSNTPVLEERPGLIVSKEEIGYSYMITPYRGNTTSFPYTSQKNTVLLGGDTKEKVSKLFVVSTLQEFLPQSEILNKAAERIATSIPNQLRGTTFFREEKSPLSNSQLTIQIKNFCQTILESNNKIFIPFPRTQLEEDEQTYLFLLNLKQRITNSQELPEDRFLLTYLEQNFPGENLDQIIQGYEETLIDTYVNEEEEKIRLEQEARSRMVTQGTFYQETESKKETQSKKQRKDKKIKTPSTENVKIRVASSSATPKEELKEKARTRATQKLEILKSVNKNGSVKFRKFMQLVNVARQGLSVLGSESTAKLNKSSHGNIKIEGSTPQTIVRPHGDAKEKSISPRGKKRILTNLVDTLFEKISQKK